MILTIIVMIVGGIWGGGYVMKSLQPEPLIDGRSMVQWIAELDSPEEIQRAKAASILAVRGEKAQAAIPALKRLASKDESKHVRMIAYFALQEIEPISLHCILPPEP